MASQPKSAGLFVVRNWNFFDGDGEPVVRYYVPGAHCFTPPDDAGTIPEAAVIMGLDEARAAETEARELLTRAANGKPPRPEELGVFPVDVQYHLF